MNLIMMSKFAGDGSMYGILERNMHSKLEETVHKHCHSMSRFDQYNIIAAHTRKAYEEACHFVDAFYGERAPRSVILDSGCGKGLSTYTIGSQNPNTPVIGIDRSVFRLSKNELYGREEEGDGEGEGTRRADAPNVLLIRAELADFWTLVLKESNWSVQSHYILYPNPYPKAKHLGRRWHGHPVFPFLLALGGSIRVRSNWDVYCQEMKLAVDTALPYFPADIFGATQGGAIGPYCYERELLASEGLAQGADDKFRPPPMTHFERKYMHHDVPLFESVTHLPVLDAETRRASLRHLLSNS